MQKPKVLIVDDEPQSLLIMKKVLEKVFSVTTQPDGLHALNQLNKEKYDLMVIDMQMPNINGKSLVNLVRSNKKDFRDIPIIIVSGMEKELDTAELRVQGFMRKPVLRDAFLEQALALVNL